MEAGRPRGILRLEGVEHGRVRYSRRLPAEQLRFFVEHYWLIDWDLSEHGPEAAATLPHPSVHLVLEKGRSAIVGVVRGKFTRVLEEKGRIFGIKFRPGGFYPFVRTPVTKFTDRVVDVACVFGPSGRELEADVLSPDDEQKRVAAADRFLERRLPPRDEVVTLINEIVSRVVSDRGLSKVDDLVRVFGLGHRRLQRIFHRYVGITPKWTIQRYRLHEALERVAAGDDAGWATVALDLGYVDQAHFINDFRTVVGCTPGEYRRGRSSAEITSKRL
jgi:AraC-like DNA-binding protein